ncbi:Helicase associated domain protein [Streptacidiphilus sp. N1-10]|uniref:Helicase associated domain protein n=1 Tax=Streptacidiphilus jeojiensis TaxID=3229225 RepID=A0ABV6XEE6_9ACTN
MNQATTSPRPTRRLPRAHQEAHSNQLSRHLRRNGSRALYEAACGTGKTFTALLVAERLGAELVLWVMPTLDLIAQTAQAWRQDGRTEPMLAVCSADFSTHPTLARAGITTVSDVGDLAAALADDGPQTVLTTYASLEKFEQAYRAFKDLPPFDLTIVDEAHRVSGHADKAWAVIHDAKKIRTHRRLYMTATARDWDAPDLTEDPQTGLLRRRPQRPGPDQLAVALSMSDTTVFGPCVSYPLAQAIADGIVADYLVLVPTITDDQLRTQLNRPLADARRTTALHLAVLGAMKKHSLKKVIVYFNTVADAESFTTEFPATLRALTPEHRLPTAPTTVFISGDHTPEERAEILQTFTTTPYAIMANAKLLAEGINLPHIDAVVFADPTRSVVRCAQGLGRSVRKPGGDKTAYLIVPTYIPPGADPQDILGSAYEPVWAMAGAMHEHDFTIRDNLPHRSHRRLTETRQESVRRWRFDFDADPQHVARAMDLVAFNPGGPTSLPRRRLLAAAQRYHDEHGDLAVPATYTDAYGYALGRTLAEQRAAHRLGALDPVWTAELDMLGIVWDPAEASRQGNLMVCQEFYDIHQHLAIPESEPGGKYLVEQRALEAKGQLPAAQARALDRIDPHWRLPYGADWTRKYHLVRSHLRSLTDPGLLTVDTQVRDINAGGWLLRQHRQWSSLQPGQRALLTQARLDPDTHPLKPPTTVRRTFTENADLGAQFHARYGRPPKNRDEITVNGQTVKIGLWYTKARANQRRGQLTPQQSELMSQLFGPDWSGDVPGATDPRPETSDPEGTTENP